MVNSDLKLVNTKILKNSAGIGGGIRYLKMVPYFV